MSCSPLGERCQGAEDGVQGVTYVVGEFGFVSFAAGEEVVSICVRGAAAAAGLGRGGHERRAKFALGHEGEKGGWDAVLGVDAGEAVKRDAC